MVKSRQVNESLELALQIEFATLGNILGDYLMFLELNAIESIKDTPYTAQTRQLLDYYAEQFDKILSHYKACITSDIKNLQLLCWMSGKNRLSQRLNNDICGVCYK